MPKLRAWSLRLTRNSTAADDLVQDVAAKVLANQDRFIPGTNFKAWVHRIMVNHFISGVRVQRAFVSVDEITDIPVAAQQHDKVALDQVTAEFTRLPNHLQTSLRQIVIEQQSYEDVSKASGCAIERSKAGCIAPDARYELGWMEANSWRRRRCGCRSDPPQNRRLNIPQIG